MSLTLTKTNDLRPGFRKLTLATKFKLGIQTITIITWLTVMVIGVLMLVHLNQAATRGYVIRKLEIEKSHLKSKMQVLKMQEARAKSLGVLYDSIEEEGLIEPKSVKYVIAKMHPILYK